MRLRPRLRVDHLFLKERDVLVIFLYFIFTKGGEALSSDFI